MNAEQMSNLPQLRRPILLAAFEGWNDAGDAASSAVEHLALEWDARPLADIDSDEYYDFQVNRPTVKQVDGVTRRIEWPTTSISYCSPRGADRDIVLVRGIEPNMRWRAFCAEIVDLAQELEVETTVMLGALLADTPHTRPVPVTGTAYSSESAARYNLAESRYEGPTGITGVLQDLFVQAGLPAVSFWAAVPHYVSTPPNPKATVALLTRVEEVLDIEVPLGTLPEQAEEWERAVTEMTEDDEEIADYVRGLEERGDAEMDPDEVMAKIDGDALAAEFERYLKRRGQGPFSA
ncbi:MULTISPECIES: PAC2 family protein [Gordonia]|uniref:Carboxylate-amine ligase n=1 Tax=Gordonia alkanivorans CGMCC 6845 TaxID=1423140 RepID=W9DDE2_9ACTN|nr:MULTISPECIES: PAC2 family protein [Gordonia]AZZ82208.1 PAC2 family protein [Gordonia alkanivorans]ETA06467.1 carboxylate-amine ligase [Gordonia alkanivorans CGMCC 6845]MDH3014425.1 PAC2 family protein [Gordonia alkanivorans]MDH3018471.1 PAC2 family protein [Gordonia alkanivorans]MDH3023526.1 PAC2 family protein [Gordonia alkanivorans]